MGGREEVSLFPIQVNAYRTLLRLTRVYTLIARPACPLFPLSQAGVLAAHPIPLLYGFRTRNTVYSVFKVPREARSTRLSLRAYP